MKGAVASMASNRRVHVLVVFVFLCFAAFLSTRPAGRPYLDALRSKVNEHIVQNIGGGAKGNTGGGWHVNEGEHNRPATSSNEEAHKSDGVGNNGTNETDGGRTPHKANFKNTKVATVSKPGQASTFVKPEGLKVVAMVFYGRRQFVDILDCYLRKNLVSNGGYLDEVMFLENTDVEEDKRYLAELVDKVPLYTSVKNGGGDYEMMWSYASDNETIYLKIDDDILFISEDAVPEIVHTVLDHPEAHDVAGNLINSDTTNWLHYHSGAVYPYLPEPAPPSNKDENTWRPSELPQYPVEPPEHWVHPTWWHPRPDHGYQVGQPGGPPHESHRWLPLKNDAESLMKTPIEGAEFKWRGNGLLSWGIAAQQHYSLFQNIEQGTMYKYHFGAGDGVWNMQFHYYQINFLAIRGKSIKEMPPKGHDDEWQLSELYPKALKKPLLIQSRAVVAHFAFGAQPEIKHTDLLNRYRAYANEAVCTPDNQKKVLTY